MNAGFAKTRTFLQTTPEWRCLSAASKVALGSLREAHEQAALFEGAVRLAVDRLFDRPLAEFLPDRYLVPGVFAQARFLPLDVRFGATVWLTLEVLLFQRLSEDCPLKLDPIRARWARGTDGKPLELTSIGVAIACALRKLLIREQLVHDDPGLAAARRDYLFALAVAAADAYDHGGLGVQRTVLIQDLAVSTLLLGAGLFSVLHYVPAVRDPHQAEAVSYLGELAQCVRQRDLFPVHARRSWAAPQAMERLSRMATQAVTWLEEWGLGQSHEESFNPALPPNLSTFDLGAIIGASDLSVLGAGYCRLMNLFGHDVLVEFASPHVASDTPGQYARQAAVVQPYVDRIGAELTRLLGRHWRSHEIPFQEQGTLNAGQLHRLFLNDCHVFDDVERRLDDAARFDVLILLDWSTSTGPKHDRMRAVLVCLLETLRSASCFANLALCAQHSTAYKRVTLRKLLEHADGASLTQEDCAAAVALTASGVNFDTWALTAALHTTEAFLPQEAGRGRTILAFLIGDSWPVCLLPGSPDAPTESREVLSKLQALYGRRLVVMGIHTDARYATADYYDYSVSLSSLDSLATFQERFIHMIGQVLNRRHQHERPR